MEKLSTLSQFLQSPDDFPWNEAIYLPKDEKWSVTSPIAVWNPDDHDEGDEDPRIARDNGLAYVLGVSAGQDIVANARERKPDVTTEELFSAFLFYYKNDSFTIFE